MLSSSNYIKKKSSLSQIKLKENLCINLTETDLKVLKDICHNKKNLNNDDIAKDLNNLSDDSEIFSCNHNKLGKNQNNLSSITLKFRRLPGQLMYKVVENKIGRTEKKLRSTKIKVTLNETQKKLRKSKKINMNYNYLVQKQKENSKEKVYLESQNLRRSTRGLFKHKETEKNEVNTRKRSIKGFDKLKNLESSNEESENGSSEVDENIMYIANTNLSRKPLKTRRTSNQIHIESNYNTLSKHSEKLLKNSIETDIKLSIGLKTPSKNDIKLLKVSTNTPAKSISRLKTQSKNNSIRVKKSTRTPTKSLSDLRTPTKRNKKVSNVSMNTPTRAFKELNLNESSRPMTRRMTINALMPDNSLQNNSTPKRSICKSLKDDSNSINKTSTRKRSLKYTILNDDDSEMDEDQDDSAVDKDYENSSDEYSSEKSEKESIDSEGESYDEYFDSLKRQKFVKKTLDTPRKTCKINLKTPSKISKKASEVLAETPTKRLSQLSLKNSLSPSVHQRTANIVKPSTPLQEVRLKLHVSVLPKSLPCREEQFNDIYTYLHARLLDGSGGCIYISGVPGTGKTATVNEVIRCLKKSMNGGKLSKFEFIDINGMKLSEPRQAYVQIWKQLTGETITSEAALKLLQSRFSKSNAKRNMILLLVDELDLLCTRRQDVVYNLLDWPSKPSAKLIVVTIANTMDLPERILMGRVTSRLGLTRLTFPPYNHKQLEQIVLCRLKGYNAFSGETVQLVARKVAAVSGDARRALDICRRSTEVAEANGREMVSIIDVKKALDEMIASPKIQAIKHCSDMEKVFLKAVCAEVHRTGVEEVVFKNVYFQLQTLCTFDGERTPNITEALYICARLGSWRLLLCDHSKMDIHQRLLLNATTDDVHFAIEASEA